MTKLELEEMRIVQTQWQGAKDGNCMCSYCRHNGQEERQALCVLCLVTHLNGRGCVRMERQMPLFHMRLVIAPCRAQLSGHPAQLTPTQSGFHLISHLNPWVKMPHNRTMLAQDTQQHKHRSHGGQCCRYRLLRQSSQCKKDRCYAKNDLRGSTLCL